jgi:uncharacterized protein (TIGR01244 family)
MLRQLDDKTLISGQILPDEVGELRRHGVTLIVNNRPDGEDPDQPPSVAIEQAARDAGIEYRHVPIRRGPGPAEVEEMEAALRECGEGKMLAFCRSGTRSTFAWALARREEGAERDELERSAAEAGISLAPISHLL